MQISTPFRSSELLSNTANKMVIVGITHVTLNENNEGRRAFWTQTSNVVNSLEGQTGYLGHRVRRDLLGDEGWTMTVWENESALQGFVRSPEHIQAIRKGVIGVKEARFVNVSLPIESLPISWEDAEIIMDEKGRTRAY